MYSIKNLRKIHVLVFRKGAKYCFFVVDVRSIRAKLLYTSLFSDSLDFGRPCFHVYDPSDHFYFMCLNNPSSLRLCSKVFLGEEIVMEFDCNGWLGH